MPAPPPTTLQKPPRWQRFISRRAWVLLGLCVMGASTAGISAYLPVWEHPLAWWLDLFTHWQWLYLLVGASCALWLLQSHRILPLLGLGILITATFIMAAVSLPLADVRRPDQGLRVVSANLYFNQPTPEALLQWIAQQNPDIVVLQEVSSAHLTAIQQIFNDLHQTLYPREDPFGLAVLSRLPLIAQQYLDDAADTPVLRLLLDYATRWGIEPMFSDFKGRGFGLGDSHLRHADRLERLVLIMALAMYGCVRIRREQAHNHPTPLEKNPSTGRSEPLELPQARPQPGFVVHTWLALPDALSAKRPAAAGFSCP